MYMHVCMPGIQVVCEYAYVCVHLCTGDGMNSWKEVYNTLCISVCIAGQLNVHVHVYVNVCMHYQEGRLCGCLQIYAYYVLTHLEQHCLCVYVRVYAYRISTQAIPASNKGNVMILSFSPCSPTPLCL